MVKLNGAPCGVVAIRGNHWCTTGTVTDVVTMMRDVFKRLGVDEARLADPFQLSRTDWGRRMLAEGRGAAT